MLSLTAVIGYSQQFMYVNRDTLPMYKYPDHKSNVVLLLHAPCKIAAEALTDTSADARELAKDWMAVKFFVSDGTWSGGTTYYGYVPTRYLVSDLSQVTVAGVDTAVLLSVTLPATDTSMMKPMKASFRESSRGGCYYIDSTTERKYVNESYCKGVMDRREENGGNNGDNQNE